MLHYARELNEVALKIKALHEEKDILVRKFAMANADLPAITFFIEMKRYCGYGAALKWYMKAFDIGIMAAKRELDLILAKEQKEQPHVMHP